MAAYLDLSTHHMAALRHHRPRVSFHMLESLERREMLASDGLLVDRYYGGEVGERAAIIGGQVSPTDAWPWMVSIQQGPSGETMHVCGGMLLAATAVVTAAHCVEGETVSELTAHIGGLSLASTGPDSAIGISEIIVHPEYDSITNVADIAIILLEQPVIAPVVSYLRADDAAVLSAPGKFGTILGWGATREGGLFQDVLRELSVPIVPTELANAPESYDGRVTARMIAAGHAEGGSDACQGDSGGPLIVRGDEGEPRLAGIISWGEGCALPNKFGIYTRVSSFASWLDEIVGATPTRFISFSQERYFGGSTATIRMLDTTLGDSESLQVIISVDSGDRESVALLRTGPGKYEGTIAVQASEGSPEDGHLNAKAGEQLRATWTGEINGTPVTLSDTAHVIADDVADGPEDATLIGPPFDLAGEIEVSGDVDWFRFEVDQGRAYEISVILQGSLNDSVLTIYDEDGDSALAFDGDVGRGVGSQLTFVPQSSGVRYIEVKGFETNVGTYRLRLADVAVPRDDYANGVEGAALLSLSNATTAIIQDATDKDWFAFDAVAGERYDIDVLPGSLLDTQLRLFDTDGITEIAYNDDATIFTAGSRIHWQADRDGKYFLEVSGFDVGVGSYSIVVGVSDDDYGNNAAMATHVDLASGTALATGLITDRDVDWFAFTAEAGQFYEFVTRELSLRDTILTLFDPSGDFQLAANDDYLGLQLSRFYWQSPSDDEFYVQVAAYEPALGAYSLEIRKMGEPPQDDVGNRFQVATAVKVGDPFRGSIDYEADFDWFEFRAESGVHYEITVELDGLSDSVLTLIDTDGRTMLARNDDIATEPDVRNPASQIEWLTDTTGLKYVRVAGFDGARGSYLLNIKETRRDPDPEAIAADLNLDGKLDAEDIDILFAAIRLGLGAPTDQRYDFNADAVVDRSDVSTLLAIIRAVPGDADLNGVVDFGDYLTLAANFLAEEAGWASGDFDGDGRVDFEDFVILVRNFELS